MLRSLGGRVGVCVIPRRFLCAGSLFVSRVYGILVLARESFLDLSFSSPPLVLVLPAAFLWAESSTNL
jgi:hypothetical protein